MLGFFGVVALISAALMIVMRQPMRVALALITTMGSLAAIYGLLGVHFIAAFQVLIYVGAVMVFMVYVIMLLEVRDGPASRRYSRYLVPGAVLFAMLVGVLGISLWRSGPVLSAGSDTPAPSTFGISQFSVEFLSRYWLPFELTSVLLVVAIVAALGVIRATRRHHG